MVNVVEGASMGFLKRVFGKGKQAAPAPVPDAKAEAEKSRATAGTSIQVEPQFVRAVELQRA